MRIVRFMINDREHFGVIDGDIIHTLTGNSIADFASGNNMIKDGKTYPVNEIKLLAPCLPTKIVCLGVNYRPHAQEMKTGLPSAPLIFIKPPTAVIGPEDQIVLPRNWSRVDYEGELGIVIGKVARYVPETEAGRYILGYTCFNDVTERHLQKQDVQWTRAKSFDTFAPIGPWIETEIEPDDLQLETYLNGELRQSARTSELIFSISTLVSFISGVMTLLPGDVIATGTPAGVGPVKAGDIVEVKIEKIGTLRNSVAPPL